MRGRQHGFGRVEINPAISRQGTDVDLYARPVAQQLPGHDIRMMLKHRKQYAIARLQSLPPALGNKIDPLGCPAHKDNFIFRLRPDERSDPPPRGFIGKRHVCRAPVDTTMDRCIVRAHRAHGGIDHRLRLLRRGCRVEIMPVADAGEIGAEFQRAHEGR